MKRTRSAAFRQQSLTADVSTDLLRQEGRTKFLVGCPSTIEHLAWGRTSEDSALGAPQCTSAPRSSFHPSSVSFHRFRAITCCTCFRTIKGSCILAAVKRNTVAPRVCRTRYLGIVFALTLTVMVSTVVEQRDAQLPDAISMRVKTLVFGAHGAKRISLHPRDHRPTMAKHTRGRVLMSGSRSRSNRRSVVSGGESAFGTDSAHNRFRVRLLKRLCASLSTTLNSTPTWRRVESIS